MQRVSVGVRQKVRCSSGDHISDDLSKDAIESRGKSDISLDHEYLSAFRALLGDDSFVYIVRQREYTAAGT